MSNIISFEFSVVDGKKAKSSITLYMYDDGGAFSLADMNSIALVALPTVRNIIKGGIPQCRISFIADLGTLLTDFPTLAIPDPDSDVEEGAVFTWGTQDEAEPTKQRIPTFDEDLLISGTREVDETDLRVIAFTEMMTQFIETGIDTYNFTNSRGFLITYMPDAKENFRRRKRSRPRKR